MRVTAAASFSPVRYDSTVEQFEKNEAKTNQGLIETIKQLAATTDKAPGLKKMLSVVMRGAEKVLESVGGQSSTLMTLGGYPEVHILGDEFYSQTPYLYGDYMAKFSLKPFSDAWSATRVKAIDEQMSFSVWHALAAHRPLGAVNRVRKTVYEAAARFRAEHNNVVVSEPGSRADLPV